MNIIINDKAVSKIELLALIKKSKLKAIKSLRKFANIGLKDAAFIVENLENDPDYFDNNPLKVTPRGYDDDSTGNEKTIPSSDRSNFKKPRAGTHFLKPNRSNKTSFILILFIAIILFLIWAELSVGIFGTPFAGK